MELTIVAISNPNKISEIGSELDSFISKNSDNPFMLSIFINIEMKAVLRKGFAPLVLVFKIDQEIIGVAPILIKEKFGLQYAHSLFDFYLSPDLIFDRKYEEICARNFLDYVFNKLNCKFADLIFPIESHSLQMLGQTCSIENVTLEKNAEEYLNHATIPIKSSWDDFQKLKGTDWRCEFKGIRRKFDRLGLCQITTFEDLGNQKDALQKIIAVEKASWKQGWRTNEHLLDDEYLFKFLEFSRLAEKAYPDFKQDIRFLDLNSSPIAYAFIIKYKETAYIVKSTYNNNYKKFCPGIYIVNESISSLFRSNKIKLIDFQTNIPATKKWGAVPLLRVRVHLRKGFLTNSFALIIRKTRTLMIRRLMEKISNLFL